MAQHRPRLTGAGALVLQEQLHIMFAYGRH
jgi:hypothetical protein